MKLYSYECDGGSIAIGFCGCVICLPNNIGDGRFDFYVLDRDEVDLDEDEITFLATCEGETEVYRYDCGHGNDIVCTLQGRYGIYCAKHGGTIFFEKWED